MKTCFTLITMLLVAATASAQSEERIMIAGPGGPMSLRVAIEPNVTPGLPYSAEVETTAVQTLADGNRIVKRTTGRVYRDAAGRVRREEDQPSRSPSVTIVDPVANMTYTLDNDAHILWRSKMPFGPAPAELMKIEKARVDAIRTLLEKFPRTEPQAGADNLKTILESMELRKKILAQKVAGLPENARTSLVDEDLPPATIDGIRAEGHRRTMVIPADAIGNEQPIKIVTEEWTSPDLKVLLMTSHADPRSGESTYRLRSINRAAPDASLFQIPANYSIRDMEMKRNEQ